MAERKPGAPQQQPRHDQPASAPKREGWESAPRPREQDPSKREERRPTNPERDPRDEELQTRKR